MPNRNRFSPGAVTPSVSEMARGAPLAGLAHVGAEVDHGREIGIEHHGELLFLRLASRGGGPSLPAGSRALERFHDFLGHDDDDGHGEALAQSEHDFSPWPAWRRHCRHFQKGARKARSRALAQQGAEQDGDDHVEPPLPGLASHGRAGLRPAMDQSSTMVSTIFSAMMGMTTTAIAFATSNMSSLLVLHGGGSATVPSKGPRGALGCA